MEFSNLFDPSWWNSPGGKAPVTSAREEIDASTAGYRSPNGSLDPANITPDYLKKYGIAPESERDIKEIVGLGKMRADAMKGAYDMPEQTPLQFLGRALSAASVPVAYAQGNRAFGNAMTGNTLADQYNQRAEKMKMLAAQDQRDTVSETFGNVDKTTMAIQSARREREKTAIAGANMLFQRGNIQGAVSLLRSSGLGEYATALEQEAAKRGSAGSNPAAQPPAAGPSAPTAQEPPVEVPTEGVGRFSQPALGATPAAAPPAPATPAFYRTPPEVQKLYDDAEMASLFDPKLGRSALEQAQIADKAAADVWKSRIESETNSRNGRYSVQPTWLTDEKGKLVLGQIGPNGEVIKSRTPDGLTAFDPVALASAKSFEKKSAEVQGEAQGKAASGLPQTEKASEFMLDAINDLRTSPYLGRITGPMQGHLPNITGGANDATAMLEQVQGKTFLQAFNDLRGGGAITDNEGAKATAAYNRLSKLTVNDGDYLKALNDFESEVGQLREVARKKATAGLIRPNATEVEVGYGKKLYKHADGHWRPEPEGGTSVPTGSRISIQRIE